MTFLQKTPSRLKISKKIGPIKRYPIIFQDLLSQFSTTALLDTKAIQDQAILNQATFVGKMSVVNVSLVETSRHRKLFLDRIHPLLLKKLV